MNDLRNTMPASRVPLYMYRDDHEAALQRAAAAEREQARLADHNRELLSELEAAKLWLGSPQRRAIALVAAIATIVAAGVGGMWIGHPTATCARCPAIPATARLPAIIGVVVADGPTIGHWTLTATKCVRRPDGVELTAVGGEDYVIWMSDHSVEVELPTVTFALDDTKYCRGHGLKFGLADKDGAYEGSVSLDCRWNDNKRPRLDDNRLQGRIDFTRCR